MNNPLEPMRVEFPDILSWMRETVLIFRRKPVFFCLVSVAFFVACYKLSITGYITFFTALVMCQIAVVVCIVIARAADESRTLTLNIWYQSLLSSVLTVVLFSAFYVLLWVVAAKLASLLMLDEIMTESSVPPPISVLQWLYPGTISLFVVYIGVMVTTMWFLLPLSVFHKLGLIDSMKLAKHGERKNFPIVAAASYLPFMVFFVLFVFSELALVVAVLAMPLFGIYLYVSFRHVFMGRKESEPAVVKASEAVPVESG